MQGRPRRIAAGLAALLLAGMATTAVAARPAPLEGLWCGTGLLHEFRLRLAQQDRDVRGTLERKNKIRTILGQVDGRVVRTEAVRYGSLVLELVDNELRITGGDGPLALTRGQTFARASGGRCASEHSAGIANHAAPPR